MPAFQGREKILDVLLRPGPVSEKFEQVLLENRHVPWCRQRLVASCARFAYKCMKESREMFRVSSSDLYMAALSGICTAIDRYDTEKKPRARLLTYAFYCIRSAVINEARHNFPIASVPHHAVMARVGKQKSYDERYQATHEEALKLFRRKIVRLDPALLIEEHYSKADEYWESCQKLSQLVLADLEPRARTILEMRFGINGYPPSTLSEVGKHFGLTKERIRQIEYKALRKLEREFAKEYQEMVE